MASTRVEGASYPTGHATCLVGTSCALRTPFSCMILIFVGKNSLYNLPKILTTVSRKIFCLCFELFLPQIRAICRPRIRKEKAMWLITLQTLRSMGTWIIVAGPLRKKKTTSLRESRRRAQMKMKSHYLNLGICMWSLKSQASLIEQRNLRPSLSFFASYRRTNRNYAKRY